MVTISGGAGNDSLSGTLGDKVYGRDGDDTITILANFPTRTASTDPVFTIDVFGGAGTDTLVADFRNAAQAYTNVFSAPRATSEYSGFFVTRDQSPNQLLFEGIDRFVFMSGAAGGAWYGGAGDDIFYSGSTLDSLQGGAGNDVYVLSNRQTFIDEKAGEGDADEVRMETASVSIYGLDAIERVTGLGTVDQMVQGNDANNVVDGGLGADTMIGGKGDDIYIADDVGDRVHEEAGEGIDHVFASADHQLRGNIEKLTSTSTSGIHLFGDSGDNIITGSLLVGSDGADGMAGGEGNDTFIVRAIGNGQSRIDGGDGYDTADFSQLDAPVHVGSNIAVRGVEKIVGTDFDDAMAGDANANLLVGGAGNDRFYGEGGADTFEGGAGDDVFMVDGADVVIVEGADGGFDEVRANVAVYALTEGAYVEALTGGIHGALVYGPHGWEELPVDYRLTGNSLRNRIETGSGNDVIDGGGGADRMRGGEGNDIYYVDDRNDEVDEYGWYTVDPIAGGIDEVRTSTDYTLGERVENLTSISATGLILAGNDLDNIITGSLFGSDAGASAASFGANAAALSYADFIDAGGGNDTIVIRSFAPETSIWGGDGIDTVDFTQLTSGVGNLGGAATPGLHEVELVLGSAYDDILKSERGAARIEGAAGNDVLGGLNRFGIETIAETLVGGIGNDTFLVDDAGDVVIEEETTGDADEVRTILAAYVLADNVEGLASEPSFEGDGQAGAAGAVSGQRLTGNGLDNWIYGSDRDDVIDGGAGADRMKGGLGNDLFVVDNEGDRIVDFADAGIDTVQASISYSLAGIYADNLVLTGSANLDGTGNKGDNVLTGNSGGNVLDGSLGNDRLDGGGGADLLKGGLGDDVYVIADASARVREQAGEGTDRVDASVDYSIGGQYVEGLTLTGGAISGTGNGLDNVLIGNDAANRLRGGGGDDRLDGGAGADRLAGESGNDVYIVDNEHDEAIELAGDGYDRVESSVSYSLLGQYSEALTLTGIRSVNATGNSLDNMLTGNAAANRLRGGAGDDVLAGGAGKDSLEGGTGHDAFVFDVAPIAKNADTILDFKSGEDSIRLDRAVYAALGEGALDPSVFSLGSAAGDAGDRIVYDPATGAIYYDADGNGAGQAMLFATVSAGTLLTAADFVVF